MSAGHTKGPWKIGNADIYADGDDGDDIVICAIGQSGGFRSSVYSVVKAHKPEGRANTSLIASAPDLLEALEGMVSAFAHAAGSQYQLDALDAARAAIAKAGAA